MNARTTDNLNAILDLRLDAVTIVDGKVTADSVEVAAIILEAVRVHLAAIRQELPKCPACSGAGRQTENKMVHKCERCSAVFTPAGAFLLPIQALQIVSLSDHMLANAGPEGQFYFDLVVSSDGKVHRMHGWADRATKRVIQWG